ncbi:hypothetical protein C0992_009444 [Termitomyces sp. T32_za158]|nr:hypothetical protein C0992_009444 [Termitomyces sp. T32_za158]
MASQTTNLYEIDSTPRFQELLSADLQRISLLNFWAPWAEPCKQMNEVVKELAKKYPKLLVLNVSQNLTSSSTIFFMRSMQIEAETHSEIAESFDVEAVPLFVVLQGHTLLERISGADAPKLTQAIATHTTGLVVPKPQSVTTQSPAPASDVSETEKTETPEELEKRMRGLMNQSKVVLFMKGSPDAPRCGFSRKISALLKENNVEFSHFDILTDEAVRQGLKKLNDWPTFPQLIVKGELVGGLDIVQEMVDNGELKEAIA